MAAGRQLEQVERVDRAGLHAGDVAEALGQLLAVHLGVVDDERAAALTVPPASQLTLSGAELLGLLDLLNVGTGTDGLQERYGSGGLGVGTTLESGRVDDERNFGDGGDLVAAGKEKRGQSGGGEGRGSSESPGEKKKKRNGLVRGVANDCRRQKGEEG